MANFDVHSFSDLVYRLTSSAIEQKPEAHQAYQIEILKEYIPCDAAWWGWSNLSAGRTHLINTGLFGLPPSFESAVRAVLHLDPLVHHARNLEIYSKTIDVQRDELRREFRQCLDAYEIRNVLNGHCRMQGSTQFNFFLSLYSRDYKATFTVENVKIFRAILRHIEQNLTLSVRAQLRTLAPKNGEAAFVSVGGKIVHATRGFMDSLEKESLSQAKISEILTALSCEKRKWLGTNVTLESVQYRPDLILIRLASYNALTLLPAKESEVAEFLIAGLTMREISEKRQVSHNTIRNQVAAIYRKLGVKNRAGLLAAVKDERKIRS